MNTIITTYRDAVNKATQYMQAAYAKNGDGGYMYSQEHQRFIVDASVLKFFIAWETFLESVFSAFLLKKQTLQGTYVNTFVTAVDFEHAKKLLVGTNTYFDWANPDKVITLSKLYLGEINPIYNAVASIKSDLFDLKTIRNAAAHLSSTTQKSLESMVQRKTGRLAIGIKPADFMISTYNGTVYWYYYKDLLDAAAESIANGNT